MELHLRLKKNKNSQFMKIKICPICDYKLIPSGKKYSVDKIRYLWTELDVNLSENVINDLKKQSDYTELHKCPNCKLNLFLPLLIGTPKFYEDLHKKMKYYEDDKWDFHEALKDIDNKQTIIEIGCGPGNFLVNCIRKGIDCYGTEYNEDAIKSAKEKGIVIIDSDELKLKKSYFDAVFCFHVLEHVANPVSFFSDLVSILKPDGILCISVPNQKGPIKYIDPCIMNMPPHHITRWELKTFKIISQKFDLKLKKVSYEPLLFSNHSYYSMYLVNSILHFKLRIFQIIRTKITMILTKYFEYLRKKKLQYFKFLKGQAIYIVFKKKN